MRTYFDLDFVKKHIHEDRDLKNSLDTSFDEGKEEGRKEVAINLLKLNIPVDKISEATGLTVDEIMRLK